MYNFGEAKVDKSVQYHFQLNYLSYVQIINQYQLGINPLNAQLNPICQLLALLVAHHILHVGSKGLNRLLNSPLLWQSEIYYLHPLDFCINPLKPNDL
jgi:hypothetical protein